MAKKPATKAEREHMGMVAELGCIICRRPAEVHHVARQGGQRSKHIESCIPLCPDHHRNGNDCVHAGRRTFEARYGTEKELLAKTLLLLRKG